MNLNRSAGPDPSAPTNRRPLRQYEAALVRLQELTGDGADESGEADSVRDEMDGSWAVLTGPERNLMSGLSADLFMLNGDERREADVLFTDAAALDQQRAHFYNDHAWVEFLGLLRRGPTNLADWYVASVRANAYEALGLQRAAARFLARSDQLKPNDIWKARVMILARRGGDHSYAVSRAEAAVRRGDVEPALLIVAATTLFLSSSEHDSGFKETCRQIVESAGRALTSSSLDDSVRAMGLVCRGSASACVGDDRAAREAFREAIALSLEPIVGVARKWLETDAAGSPTAVDVIIAQFNTAA